MDPQRPDVSLGPDVREAGTAAWDFQLRTGRMPLSAPGDPSYQQGRVLEEQQIRALVAYGATLGDGPDIPRVVTDAASVPRGWELFINNCAACHGASGTGGSVGPGAFAPSLLQDDPTTIAEAILTGPGTMPRFAWDEAELGAVTSYIGELAEPHDPGGLPLGGLGPVPEGLVAGILGLGALALAARLVAGRSRPHP
jgi:ubiquinol-cytochrome c reductase cytochrome c subunit